MYCFKLLLLFVTNPFTISSLKPNVVLIITDDQDLLLNGLKPMEKTKELLGRNGVIFENAYVNTPLCCPSRSTILTGKYLHNTRVYNNSLAGNCSSYQWQRNHEPYSIASILKNRRNYITFYAGKYLNQYGTKDAGGTRHVPTGYDWWIGLKGNSVYYNYVLSVNGSAQYFGGKYLTDVLKEYALTFLNQKIVKDAPFFMTIATPAPHQPFTPAPRHRNAFPNVKALCTPSFNISSVDKHWLIQMAPKHLPKNVSNLDTFQRLRMQSLLSVDELIEDIILKLQDLDILERTYIIFTSDNGYHLGQFSQPYDKRQPYETDVRVPFIIRGPNIKKKFMSSHPISMVDVAPTLLEMTGISEMYQMDGKSFLKYIQENSVTDKQNANIFIEYFGEWDENHYDDGCDFITDRNVSHCQQNAWCKCSDSRNNTYVCIRTFYPMKNFKFCRFLDNQNFVEAYDMTNDPYELHNLFENMKKAKVKYYDNLLKQFITCKGNDCII